MEIDDLAIGLFRFADPALCGEIVHFIDCTKADRVHINVKRPFDAPATAFAHATPVLEGIADQGVWRNRCYRFIPVLYLDRIQGDFLHDTVCSILRH